MEPGSSVGGHVIGIPTMVRAADPTCDLFYSGSDGVKK